MTSAYSRAHFVGLRKASNDGFELHRLHYQAATDSYIIPANGTPDQEESLEGAGIDFFVLDGDACLQDMDATVSKLNEQTQGEEIMRAVMFSCGGRGPESGSFIPETMADASRFASSSPDVPCLGFYAGGEIGHLALAGKENVFQTGRATRQAFTAVFALFVVPVVEQQKYELDDCEET
jgi:small ligand-binding sensory domain FIST